MCGIVGMAGDLTLKDREIFEDLLDVCQLRGRDSTGVIRVNRNGSDYTYAKRVGPPTYLFDSREYQKNIRETGISALVGHCRAKTIGDVSVANAHPFDIEESGIIGVHNGTLKNFYSLSGHTTGNTDSQSLYETIAKEGAEETFSKLEGAWACVWWDANTRRLNFIRNKERPLWVTYSKDKRKLYWASEAWMFGAVYRKEALWDGDGGKIYIPLDEDILYSIEIEANALKDKPVFKIKEGKKIEKKPRPLVGFHHGGISTNTSETTSTTSTKKGGEVANPFFDDEIPHHLTVPVKKHDETTKSGTTQTSNDSSSTTSKGSVVQLRPSTNITHSEKSTNFRPKLSLPDLRKTSKNEFFDGSGQRLDVGSKGTIDLGNIYNPAVGVDTRYIRKLDLEYITDLRTGKEEDEHAFRTNTGGRCCHCGSKLNSLKEVAEIFDNGKRYLCVSCVTPRADPVLEAVKECA